MADDIHGAGGNGNGGNGPGSGRGGYRPGAGRPKGAKSVLPAGIRALIEAAKQADRLGIKTDEAYGTILGVMRGQISGRHLRERLSAAIFVLEQEIGKARQKIVVERAPSDGVYRAEFADGIAVSAAVPPRLPN